MTLTTTKQRVLAVAANKSLTGTAALKTLFPEAFSLHKVGNRYNYTGMISSATYIICSFYNYKDMCLSIGMFNLTTGRLFGRTTTTTDENNISDTEFGIITSNLVQNFKQIS